MTESVPAESGKLNDIEVFRLNEVIAFRQLVIKFILKIEDAVFIFEDLLKSSLCCCLLQIILSSEKNELLLIIEVRHSRDCVVYELISEELVSRAHAEIDIRNRCFVENKSNDLVSVKPQSVQVRIR